MAVCGLLVPWLMRKLQIRYFTDMDVVHITSLLQIISIENGCEGYNTNLYILAKWALTGSIEISTQEHFLLLVICNTYI